MKSLRQKGSWRADATIAAWTWGSPRMRGRVRTTQCMTQSALRMLLRSYELVLLSKCHRILLEMKTRIMNYRCLWLIYTHQSLWPLPRVLSPVAPNRKVDQRAGQRPCGWHAALRARPENPEALLGLTENKFKDASYSSSTLSLVFAEAGFSSLQEGHPWDHVVPISLGWAALGMFAHESQVTSVFLFDRLPCGLRYVKTVCHGQWERVKSLVKRQPRPNGRTAQKKILTSTEVQEVSLWRCGVSCQSSHLCGLPMCQEFVSGIHWVSRRRRILFLWAQRKHKTNVRGWWFLLIKE